ncbi:hypothetical protein GCM10011519_16420 [Marmoricola endophyticus]|uniref:Uncharacterized protein n=1 Tax=Marmoricola endophyticus TaxID=2040280 RepID=A0A917BIN6_9ACTN|nr:hypothetical protein GCM10011519_16420 [Marmoricola endophyticus]
MPESAEVELDVLVLREAAKGDPSEAHVEGEEAPTDHNRPPGRQEASEGGRKR